MITTSISKGTVTATATFRDLGGAGNPVSPDADTEIVWTVYGQDRETIRHQEVQTLADEQGTGVFTFSFEPTIPETVSIECVGTVGGKKHAGRVLHIVQWV